MDTTQINEVEVLESEMVNGMSARKIESIVWRQKGSNRGDLRINSQYSATMAKAEQDLSRLERR